MTRKITRNVFYWILGLGLLSHWLLYAIVGYDVMIEVASNLMLGTFICLTGLWARDTFRAVLKGDPGEVGEHLLNLGLFILFFGISAWRLWLNFLRWLGRPEWMLNSPFLTMLIWTVFWGGLTILLSSEAEQSEIPARSYVVVIIACAIGFTVAGINIGLFLAGIITR